MYKSLACYDHSTTNSTAAMLHATAPAIRSRYDGFAAQRDPIDDWDVTPSLVGWLPPSWNASYVLGPQSSVRIDDGRALGGHVLGHCVRVVVHRNVEQIVECDPRSVSNPQEPPESPLVFLTQMLSPELRGEDGNRVRSLGRRTCPRSGACGRDVSTNTSIACSQCQSQGS